MTYTIGTLGPRQCFCHTQRYLNHIFAVFRYSSSPVPVYRGWGDWLGGRQAAFCNWATPTQVIMVEVGGWCYSHIATFSCFLFQTEAAWAGWQAWQAKPALGQESEAGRRQREAWSACAREWRGGFCRSDKWRGRRHSWKTTKRWEEIDGNCCFPWCRCI